MSKDATLGGIIKVSDGHGFKLIFKTAKEAQHYKDMVKWILEGEQYKVKSDRGYFDRKV